MWQCIITNMWLTFCCCWTYITSCSNLSWDLCTILMKDHDETFYILGSNCLWHTQHWNCREWGTFAPTLDVPVKKNFSLSGGKALLTLWPWAPRTPLGTAPSDPRYRLALRTCHKGRLHDINDGANAPWKIGGRFSQELKKKCINFLNKIKNQILGLHCTEVSSYDCCHQMSDFKAKMHQIRFELGLSPKPHWASLQRSPGP